MKRMIGTVCLVLVGVSGFVPGTTGSARAAGETLNLPPPPGFTCQGAGNGATTCRWSYAEDSPGFVQLPPFLVNCSGQPLYNDYRLDIDVTFFYNNQGNLTRIIQHSTFVNMYSLSATGEGTVVRDHKQRTYITTLAVPGDLSTATTSVNGLYEGATTPGEGQIVHAAGHNDFIPSSDAFAAICAALSA